MPSVSPVYYSYDGTGNNLANPAWGSAGADLLRTVAPDYGDGVSTPGGAGRPGARDVSNVVGSQPEDVTNDRHMSDWVYAWGQFIDHDLDLTPAGTDPADMPVPLGDADFDPTATGTQTILFGRAVTVPGTGTGPGNPLRHPNQVTAYLDGSMIYGSDAARAAALRTFQGGRLKTSDGDLPPFDAAGLPVENDTHALPDSALFLAGDVRVNENAELSAVTALFVREHNYQAGRLAAANPAWTDEQIYQAARRLVTAEIQNITYSEYLTALLGPDALTPYTGYDPAVNPGVAAEFSIGAYRFGHSVLNSSVDFFNDDGSESHDGVDFNLAADDPALLLEPGASVDNIVKYLSADVAQEEDTQVEDDFRNLLFAGPGEGGLDLYAIDIQRGRDVGLPDYNSARVAYGLPAVTNFSQITSNPDVQAKLEQLYGSVNNIDLLVGGLAEDHAPGGSLGPTFARIIEDQFERTRDGDRLWYQSSFSGDDLRAVTDTTLADVIRRNTGITNLQSDVFFFSTGTISGRVFQAASPTDSLGMGAAGREGVTVELLDAGGNVVDRTVTAADGSYSFDTGGQDTDYQVRVVPPARVHATTPTTLAAPLADGSGAAQFGLDFGLAAVAPLVAVGGGAGGSSMVYVYDAAHAPVAHFYPFEPSYTGAVSLAVGDVNGDGVEDVVVAAGSGGGPRVEVIDGTKLGAVGADGVIDGSAVLATFFAYDPAFRGGVSVAVGGVAGSGPAVVTGAGPGGGPHVRVFAVANGGAAQVPGALGSFMAYDPAFRGGVNVAAADVFGTGLDDIVTGAGTGGGPHVQVFGPDGSVRAAFMAYEAAFGGGVNVAAGDLDGDGMAEVVTGPGVGGGPRANVYRGGTLSLEASFLAATDPTADGLGVAVESTGAILTAAGPGGRVRAFDGRTLARADDSTALPSAEGDGVVGAG